jgi:hypothetical protein
MNDEWGKTQKKAVVAYRKVVCRSTIFLLLSREGRRTSAKQTNLRTVIRTQGLPDRNQGW